MFNLNLKKFFTVLYCNKGILLLLYSVKFVVFVVNEIIKIKLKNTKIGSIKIKFNKNKKLLYYNLRFAVKWNFLLLVVYNTFNKPKN